MRFLNMKVITVIILSIVLLIGAFIAFYQLVLNDIMEAQLKDIKIAPLKERVSSKDSLNSYGLSDAEKDEIWNNIDNYEYVIYIFEIKNTSSWLAYSVHHRVQPQFSESTKKLQVKNEKQLLFPQNLPPGESYKTSLSAIIKTDNQLSGQEILDIVSKDRFTITGGREVWVIPFGDESITVGPFQKNQ
ncbi:hypothetical protein [Thermoactinomyces mirandus]|uniref:Uncharacterized protein n=1 Tax=Thermoactinomyces mirandus TaxID=2756294 RepID=A0A7W2ARL8_9BACL|nr:hypothetical protein [Thermoactinomyces mirandus]MBA4602738.1 hypothetical protein [Thermoactinomyces mirandus]